jgi:hypothetical protein
VQDGRAVDYDFRVFGGSGGVWLRGLGALGWWVVCGCEYALLRGACFRFRWGGLSCGLGLGLGVLVVVA